MNERVHSRTSTTFDEVDLELALAASQATADRLEIKEDRKQSPSKRRSGNDTDNRTNADSLKKKSKKNNRKTSSSKPERTPSGAVAVKGGDAGKASPSSSDGVNRVGDAQGKPQPVAVTKDEESSKRRHAGRGSEKAAAGKKARTPARDADDVKGGIPASKSDKVAPAAKKAGEGGGFWAASTLLQECLACNYTAGAEM